MEGVPPKSQFAVSWQSHTGASASWRSDRANSSRLSRAALEDLD
jgi:hypothetical protein